ncbi:MAG: hypothetical protein IAE79_24300 [Anaerolinea sp.]|nr:hypothetical protein [Anaerolinea sp.]
MSQQKKGWALFIGALLLTALILTDWLPLLRGPAPETAVWHWPYLLRPLSRWWVPGSAALLLLIAIWWLLTTSRRRGMALMATAVGVVLLQIGLIYAQRPAVSAELIDRTLAVQTGGYFWTAANLPPDIHTVLRTYPALMADFESEHGRTHPPGLVLLNWLTISGLKKWPALAQWLAALVWPQRCTDLWLLDSQPATAAALGIWAWLPVLAAAATVFPAYALARRLHPAVTAANDATAGGVATFAVSLIATLPALLLFAPLADQLYVPLTLLIFLAFHKGLTERRRRWLLLAGWLLSLSSFLSIGNVMIGVPLFVYGLWLWRQDHGRLDNRQRQDRFWYTAVAAFALGAASIWLIYWVGWGVPPWDIAQAAMRAHYDLVTDQRAYATWFIFNLVDLFIFAGPVVCIGAVIAATAALHPQRQRHQAAAGLAMGVLLLILLLNLLGSTRGEVGRIWLFLLPLLALAAGSAPAFNAQSHRHQMLLVGGQLLVALAVGLAWQPVEAVIVRAEKPSLPLSNQPAAPLDIQFGSHILLQGFTINEGRLVPGGVVDVTLHWTAMGTATRPYTVFMHLLGPDNTLVAQQDNWPVSGQWPPTCWRAGDSIPDNYRLTLPATLAPGTYTLITGWYDARDGDRLMTSAGADFVMLRQLSP